ncbi:uracil phosphoribosyltransferase [Prochlorococcus sp. MIT 1307]|uniref:uracil phosphoribosyltransferase n=1 Tax=Prochlorococcus sp. MIT 1307 TaxID=3096219 RepID=UPI002A75DE91|nr:uracil phosphoribosyltransferase [Prochlorococcus sp. MIT 1307]
MAMTLRVVVPPHPLIGHWLTMLRDAKTPAPLYGKALEELGRWLTYEALRDWLPHREEEVVTSQAKSRGTVIEPSIPLLAMPKLPGGLELWHGGRNVLPNSHLCLGEVPNPIEKKAGIIIYMDQISDAIDLLEIIKLIMKQNVEPRRIRVISAITAQPGLQLLGENIPNLVIYCSCIDAGITDNGEIIPGIGNPSLRLTTKITGKN